MTDKDKEKETEYSEGEVILRMPVHLSGRFAAIIKARDFQFALQNFDNKLRSIVKHGSEEEQKLDADDVRSWLHTELGAYNLDLWSDE